MAQPTPVHRGIVKQVMSGDAVIIRGVPKGGPPPERLVCLSNITAPRLARRANPNQPDAVDSKDEPYAWEAREFLRKKLIGKQVEFTVEYKVPGTGREYGCIHIGKDLSAENVTESLVAEGLVEVRRGGIKATDENQQRLIQLEDAAKAAGKGKWAQGTGSDHVRNITWTLDDPRKFVDSRHGKPLPAVIEHVRDGCTVRAFLLPTFEYVTVMMSGIKSPMFKMEDGKQVPEPFAEEAKFFTESRLLQREINIILESTSNQNLLGTIIHPAGSIAELLLTEGFARCVDWSMGAVTQGPEKLRAAERAAKEKRLRIWKDFAMSSTPNEVKDKYQAKVIEVVNADALVLKTPSGEKKIFLASIRPPRPQAPSENDEPVKKDPKQRPRPLYDIPYMFEAREFLRKKLTGKKVNVETDYIQPASNEYPEKTCCTVMYSDINIAEALVSKGLAGVVRYRQDDDKRSSRYDDLLAAETRAIKNAKGIHSKKEYPLHRITDISGDVGKAKMFLSFLQRAGRSEAIVEFVASGSRLRLYLPKETCLITLLLSGIDCPRMERRLPSGDVIKGDAYGEQAYQYIRELCLQREVEVEVEAVDKGGNFIGWLYIDGTNASIALVTEGLAKVHSTAERTPHYATLLSAEDKAKSARQNIWQKYEEPTETVELAEEPVERKENYQSVIVTEVSNDLHFYAQSASVEKGQQLEKLMEHLHQEMESHPPLPGAYQPKKGDMCTAKFVDGVWYRARVEKVERSKDGSSKFHVQYIDYGNREVTTSTKMATLPATFGSLPPQATEYALACVGLPTDEDSKNEAVSALSQDILNRKLLLNVEYRVGGLEHVTLLFNDTKDDVARALVADGLILAEARREKRLAKIVGEYMKAQDKAKADHRNLWRYGDFTADDAAEFGYKQR